MSLQQSYWKERHLSTENTFCSILCVRNSYWILLNLLELMRGLIYGLLFAKGTWTVLLFCTLRFISRCALWVAGVGHRHSVRQWQVSVCRAIFPWCYRVYVCSHRRLFCLFTGVQPGGVPSQKFLSWRVAKGSFLYDRSCPSIDLSTKILGNRTF